MRHATAADLDRAEDLMLGLRALSGLKERTPGCFYRGSRAFLHFHADAGDLYVDVRFDSGGFQRMRVTSEAEQADLLRRVQHSLQATA